MTSDELQQNEESKLKPSAPLEEKCSATRHIVKQHIFHYMPTNSFFPQQNTVSAQEHAKTEDCPMQLPSNTSSK